MWAESVQCGSKMDVLKKKLLVLKAQTKIVEWFTAVVNLGWLFEIGIQIDTGLLFSK